MADPVSDADLAALTALDGAQTVAEALRLAANLLEGTSPTARLDAELLMAEALSATRSDLLLRHTRSPVPEGFKALIARRMAYEPVAYITGTQEFYGRDFAVSPAVLIPRADSEVIVETALDALADRAGRAGGTADIRVLDCGTGSGALLLSVLAETPNSTGIGIDISPAALVVAEANGISLGLGARARWEEKSWLQPGWHEGLGRFDLILSNPPYVETTAELEPNVLAWEPHGALFAGAEGLDDYAALIPQLPALLNEGGAVVLEIGATQAESVGLIAQECGFCVEMRRDLGGRPRALLLRLALGK